MSLKRIGSYSDTLSLTYQYDRNSNITQIKDNLVAENTIDYYYDVMNRVTSSEGQGEAHNYEFDLDNNRISHTVNGQETSYVYEQGQVLESVTTGDKTLTTERDAYGNLTQGEHNGELVTREFNVFNQLIKSTRDGVVTTYGYNSQRQRIWKQTGDNVIQYIYKGKSEKLLAEYTNGELTKEYIYSDGKLAAIYASGDKIYYVQTDHLGRPQVATNDSKQIVWQAQNKAFDRAVFINRISDLNIGFPGQYYDVESGLYYNINRDYDPSTGRYIQTDPIGLRGGLNTYLYAKSNPIFYTDELGLCICASGQDTANAALDSVGSSNWNYKDSKGTFGPNTNKCNLFVEEKLKQSGSYVPDVSGILYNAPTAGQWADPNFHIPGYKVIDSDDYQPGDIIAIGGYDHDPNATGHVGIVTNEGQTTSHSSITDTIVSNDWGFREGQAPTFRRCSCD